VREGLHLRFEGVDLPDDPAQLLEEAVVAAAEDAGEQAIEHWGTGNCDGGRAGARSGAPAMKKGATGALFDGNAHCTVVAPGGDCKAVAAARAGRPAPTPALPARGGGSREWDRRTCRHPPRHPLRWEGAGSRPGYCRSSSRNFRGLCRRPFSQTSRCTWAPVERLVESALAISWPTRTRSPTLTML